MAITHIDTNVGTVTVNDDVTVTAPTGIQDNDYLGGYYAHSDNDAAAVALSGFTQIEEFEDATGADSTIATFRKIASSESGDYDFTGSVSAGPNSTAAIMACFRGVDTTTPLDVAYVRATHYQKLEDPGADITPKAITTVTNGAFVLVFVWVSFGNLTAFVAPSGYTEIAANATTARNVALYYKEVASAGVESPGAVGLTDLDASDETLSITMALRPASGIGRLGGIDNRFNTFIR